MLRLRPLRRTSLRSTPPRPTPRLRAASLFAVALACCSPAPSLAQVELLQAPKQPESASSFSPKTGQQRTVERFDFEEPNNPYPVPRFWVRLVDSAATPRPGFPPFNEAAFDFDLAHTGLASIKLPTRGGSTALRLLPGTVPIFPQGDYSVSAFVRTRGLRAARAYLVARFLDQNQRILPDGEVRSLPIRSEDAWTSISIELVGIRDDAAFLQIELQLLQPDQQPARPVEQQTPHTKHDAPLEDLDAAVWFDDVRIGQIPRVELTTPSPGNVFSAKQTPSLLLTVRDLVGDRLSAHLRAVDSAGTIADETILPVDSNGRPIAWIPTLARPGWYHITLDVADQNEILTRQSTALVWLPASPHSPHPELARFGLVHDRAEPWHHPAILHTFRSLSLGHITLPVWGDHAHAADIPDAVESISTTLDELLASGASVTLCMPRLPTDLALKHSLDPDDPLSMALADERDWVPLMNPAFDRYGQRITRWLVGRVTPRSAPPGIGGDEAFWAASLTTAVSRLHKSLSLLVPGPHVTVPWRADLSMSQLTAGTSAAARPAGTMMIVPAWADRDSIDSFKRDYLALPSPRPELTIIPQYSTAPSTDSQRIITLARQLIESWRAFADLALNSSLGTTPADPADPPVRFAVNAPFTTEGARRLHLAPTPDTAVWAALAPRLAGRRIVGEYPAPDGVRCYILAPLDPAADSDSSITPAPTDSSLAAGALILWNESASPDDAFIHVYIPPGEATLVDPLGYAVPLVAPDPDRPGEPIQRVFATDSPVFIEGIDARLASLIASFKVEPEFLPAIAIEHNLELRLTNPWPTTLTGRLQIIPPGAPSASSGTPIAPTRSSRARWHITPDGVIPINIPPHQTHVIPFAVTLPPAEDAGTKRLTAILRLDSDQHLAPIRLDTPIRVGLDDISLQTKVDLLPNIDGPNVVVSLNITSRGSPERFLRIQVRAPGFPTRELVLANPPPGETIVKRFTFTDAADQLRGKRIRISIADTEAASRLNATATVP